MESWRWVLNCFAHISHQVQVATGRIAGLRHATLHRPQAAGHSRRPRLHCSFQHHPRRIASRHANGPFSCIGYTRKRSGWPLIQRLLVRAQATSGAKTIQHGNLALRRALLFSLASVIMLPDKARTCLSLIPKAPALMDSFCHIHRG